MDKPPLPISPLSAPVASRVPRIRARLCDQCPEQCAQFKAGQIVFADADAFCPINRWGKYHGHILASAPSGTVTYSIKSGQIATWQELHTYQPSGDLSQDRHWFESFARRVPAVSCQCRSHWRHYIIQNPPDWQNWFAWTVEAHNSVNRRLNKPEIPLAEAFKLWKISDSEASKNPENG